MGKQQESSSRPAPPKGYYLLPNLFTTGALFAGFYSIIASVNGMYEAAGIAICVAAVLDGFDGAVARLTNTQSDFGAQYDSMSDGISFGVAPAVASYAWAAHDLGKFGWMAAFIFAACAALRLARFNVQIETSDPKYFTGLPSPAAAGLVATMVWLGSRAGVEPATYAALVSLVTVFAGLMMVINTPYPTFKEYCIGKVPFAAVLGLIILCAVILLDPPTTLLVIALIYAMSGPVIWLVKRRKPY